MATTGEELRRRREEAGLQQTDVAERLGVSRVTVSNWERDVSAPSEENLESLAKLFGVSTAALRYPDSVLNQTANFTAHVGIPTGQSNPGEARPPSVTWPQAARVLVRRFELEAAEMGATDEDIAFVHRTLTSPETYVIFKGGRAVPMTDAEIVTEMEALAEGLRAWLRELLRRRRGR